MQRFVNEVYPRRKKSTHGTELRYRITMILQDHKEDTGEDLYDLLQSPDFSRLVTENEYREITGENIPKGHGRRGSSSGQKAMRDTKQKMTMIPLPPQEFNWGEIRPSTERPRHKGELD